MYTKWVNEIGGQYITDRGVPLEVFSLDSKRIKEYLKTVFLYTHEDGGAYFGCYSTNKSFVEDIDLLLSDLFWDEENHRVHAVFN